MNGPVLVKPDAESDARWAAWKAHGAESDHRSSVAMRWLLGVVIAALCGWLFTQVL